MPFVPVGVGGRNFGVYDIREVIRAHVAENAATSSREIYVRFFFFEERRRTKKKGLVKKNKQKEKGVSKLR